MALRIDVFNHIFPKPFFERLQQVVVNKGAVKRWLVMLDSRVVRTEPLTIRVLTAGAWQGRTAEDPGGNLVEVALDANRDRVEQLFLDVLAR